MNLYLNHNIDLIFCQLKVSHSPQKSTQDHVGQFFYSYDFISLFHTICHMLIN